MRCLPSLLVFLAAGCAHGDPPEKHPCDGWEEYVAESIQTQSVEPLPAFSPNAAACARDVPAPTEREKKARELFAQHDFNDAVIEANSAFRETGDRRMLVFAANADLEMQKFAEAYELLTQFLQVACTREEVEAVRPSIEEAGRRSGELAVECDREASGLDFTLFEQRKTLRCGERVRLNVEPIRLLSGIKEMFVNGRPPTVVAGKRVVVRVRAEAHPC
jgi:hypothetical protein